MEPNLRIVIPSRKRVRLLTERALTLFPGATVTVAASEMNDYRSIVPPERLVPHPDEVSGIAPIRQWVLDHFDDECIVFADDDVYQMISLVGYSYSKIASPATAWRVIENTANIAKEAGTAVFGFNQAFDVRKFVPMKPFLINSWAGGVIGIIGRDFRYDTSLRLRADIDFCLQVLLERRFTFIENRIAFVHKRFGLTGGNAVNRSAERNRHELDYLRAKWGRYLTIQPSKGTTLLKINVPRHQNTIQLAGDEAVSEPESGWTKR